jgi:hypothetical protein
MIQINTTHSAGPKIAHGIGSETRRFDRIEIASIVLGLALIAYMIYSASD